jgi:hypothetical protein
MRMLDRTVALSVGILVAGVLAPGVAQAQAAQSPPQQQANPQQGNPQEAAPQPTPAYPSPPATEPQDAPPARPATRRGLLFLPYVGSGSLVGADSDRYSTGLRVGALLGGHMGSLISINGELSVDIMSPNTGSYPDLKLYPGLKITERFFDLTLSPLVHFGVPHVEFVAGPKIGAFAWTVSTTYPAESADFSGFGLVYGLAAGAFFPIGRVAIGGIFSFTARKFLEDSCTIGGGGGGHCYDYYSTVDTKLISFSIALML